MPNSILLSSPLFEGNEQKYVENVLKSPYIAAGGTFLDEFEKGFSVRLFPHNLVALNSGTSAIHIALMLLGVEAGDEVICQSFTFCASANPIVYLGALPVFVDSEEDTWNICPEALEIAIKDRLAKGKKPKAIIVVDLFGMPAKYDELFAISQHYGIPILEDAAESLGSLYKGQVCGSLGEIGIFSFNGNKIITTGTGGGLISDNPLILEKARFLASQAREKVHYFEHHTVGYNYRMGNVAAAIGKAQLETLDQKVEQRRAVYDRYKVLLSEFEGIFFLEEPEGFKSNRWLTTVLIDPQITGFDKEDLRSALEKENIESRYLWKPLHLQVAFKDSPYYGGNVALQIYGKGLCLPSSSHISEEEQKQVVLTIANQYQKVSD
ncbi:putative PLP-dependent enzyme possibly involved in cell wall biogenesis [Belliella baltica DSM 15883]|uniref:Putative PLP-dependent enzyme possibly involved in cell wall biogenesis n=1 Tax=Belliella baltica (strain DSM 15883 / CIP 108006 / LMG 21964 / BA134) TaxID=866536 RepID=I3Z5Z1_BELBD|nr:DegT/DnrJ/EryC1/StrS family aminotransferase [Belliella baltica]AFL84659.1 putative PLP-dependent enzyme possibly involved in cell wall biogenesis [Belliella baltica DSM 15883]